MKKEIEAAIKERNRYLAINPHMQKFQDEIDIKLSHLDHTGDRMALLDSLMEQKLIELKIALDRAKGLIGDIDNVN